jgi:dTDP-4-amino-4,6-dideoxygalactose transaminase
LFQFYFQNRDKLLKFLISYGIDAKIHYPIPLHLQPAYKYLKYKKGDFVMSEYASKKIISLPVHEFIKKKELDFMINKIKDFINNES